MSRVEPFEVVIPLNTPLSAPVTIATPFDLGIVRRIEIRIPPGPSGLMGFQIRRSGEGVFPREPTRFVVADDERIAWDVNEETGVSGWAVRGFNTDRYDHTVYIRYIVDEIPRGRIQPTRPLTIEQPDQAAPNAEDDLSNVDELAGVT